MEVFHSRKYGRFSLSAICLFLELEAVPGTDTEDLCEYHITMDEALISYEFTSKKVEGDVSLDQRAGTSIYWCMNPSSSRLALICYARTRRLSGNPEVTARTCKTGSKPGGFKHSRIWTLGVWRLLLLPRGLQEPGGSPLDPETISGTRRFFFKSWDHVWDPEAVGEPRASPLDPEIISGTQRGSCRGDEGLSIDNTALVSIDGDVRIWAEQSRTRTLILESLGTMPSLGLFSELNSIEIGLLETYESRSGNLPNIVRTCSVKLAGRIVDRQLGSCIDRRYIHMSTRSNKGIGLLLVEPLDLERVIHKSKRAADTLQTAIGSVEIQMSIDTAHLTSIETAHLTPIDTAHLTLIDTAHLTSIDTVHPTSIDTVHPTSIDTVHLTSIDTVHPPSTDTDHPPSTDTVHPPSDTTCLEAEKVEVLILNVDENGMLRDEEDEEYMIPIQLLDDIMAKRDGLHVSGELSRVEEAGTEGTTSTSTDITTSTSTDITTSTSTDITTSTSTDITTSTSTDITTSTPTDITTSTSIDNVAREITMEDSLELEEWLEDMDQNSKKKLDDDQHTSRGDPETSKASIGRHQPDEIDRQPPHIIDLYSPDIDRHRQPLIDRHHPPNIDRFPLLDVPPGCIIEMEPIEERMNMSKASQLAVPKNQRPSIWTEEAAGFHKKVKRIHDPMKIVVPCAVFEAESPIPPDNSVHLDSSSGILDDHQHIEASQRGLRFQDEVNKGPAERVSINTIDAKSNDINKLKSIDTTTSSSIDTGRVSEHREILGMEKPPRDQTNGVRKSRVCSRCFSQPFSKLRAFLIAEIIDKGEEFMEEDFTQE
ncbi:hypothetical protein DY000_02049213 [Brassica cretica]|uniref:Uncharacterized protein n=1 Tax=Brassica cretica TaxID=69181 RepID=A0ABQ7EYX7_BRACR|nr:hypothetical protein DY000_02049213 [Brassica cretica]